MKSNKAALCISLVSMIALPILNSFGLTLIHALISGDILMKTAASAVEILNGFLSAVIFYFNLGIVLNSHSLNDRKTRSYIIGLYAVYLLITYIAVIAVQAIVLNDFASEASYQIGYMILNLVYDFIIFGAVMAAAYKPLAKKQTLAKSFLITVVTVLSAGLLQEIIETVMLIVNYGSPITISEVIYVAQPFITLLIYAAAGFFTMQLSSMVYDRLTRL